MLCEALLYGLKRGLVCCLRAGLVGSPKNAWWVGLDLVGDYYWGEVCVCAILASLVKV